MKNYPEKRNDNRDRYLQKDTRPYSIFHDPFFDAVDDLFRPMFYNEPERMRTDITETDNGYKLDVELPGFNKKDINVSLEDGYLTVSAQKNDKQEEDSEKGGKYVLKECSVSCRRSYYVGENVEKDKIKAKYTDGILSLNIPKDNPKELTSTHIDIE